MPVRLFVGNLPYTATEDEVRQHFSAVAPPVEVVIPVDRETGRPRGFAFVDFADRAVAEQAIQRLDTQPFKGRSLAVSEARPREARSGPPPSRPYSPGGAAPGAPPPRDRGPRPVGPEPPPRRLRGPAKTRERYEGGPKGPIPERRSGRFYDVDDEAAANVPADFDDFATSAPPEGEKTEKTEDSEDSNEE